MPAMEKLSYDPVKDFSHIAVIGITPMVLAVHPGVASSLQEFVSRVRANPGKYSYGTTGAGGLVYLAGELLKKQAGGLDIADVAYKGSGQSYQDLMAGHIPAVIASISVMLPNHRSGKVRMLAVLTEKRVSSAPDIPTAVEQGFPGVLAYTFNILCAPANTPKPVIDRLNAEFVKALRDAQNAQKLEAQGLSIIADSPEHFASYVAAESQKWRKVVTASGAKAD